MSGGRVVYALAVALAVSLLAAAPTTAAQRDRVQLDPDAGPGLLAAEIAGAVASADEIIIARDDAFPDALASGALQADGERVLFLVPTGGPLPTSVLNRIDRIARDQATVLGGPAAVGPDVVAELQLRGFAVDRYAGDTRITTAAAIADHSDFADARTAILLRAFGAPDADSTQGFADALAAGALAADLRAPILLTDSAVLSPATAEWLRDADLDEVLLVGGPAAIGPAVEEQVGVLAPAVRRIAGTGRAETAVAVARELGARPGDGRRVTLLDGRHPQAWAPGFAAAALASINDSVILLAEGDVLPEPTRQFLAGDAAPAEFQEHPVADTAPFRFNLFNGQLRCVTAPGPCEMAARAIGIPTPWTVIADPPEGSSLVDGQTVTLTATAGQPGTAIMHSNCLVGPPDLTPGMSTYIVNLPGAGGECRTEILIEYQGGPSGPGQRELLTHPFATTVSRAVACPGPFESLGSCGIQSGTLSSDGTTVAIQPSANGSGVAPWVSDRLQVTFVDLETGDIVSRPFAIGNQMSASPLALSTDGTIAVAGTFPHVVWRDKPGSIDLAAHFGGPDCSNTNLDHGPFSITAAEEVLLRGQICDTRGLFLVDLQTLTIVSSTPLEGFYGTSWAVSADGTVAAAEGAMVELTTGAITELDDLPRRSISLTADGSAMTFYSDGDETRARGIYRQRLPNGQPELLLDNDAPGSPTISVGAVTLDGSRVPFAQDTGDPFTSQVLILDTGQQATLLASQGDDGGRALSGAQLLGCNATCSRVAFAADSAAFSSADREADAVYVRTFTR